MRRARHVPASMLLTLAVWAPLVAAGQYDDEDVYVKTLDGGWRFKSRVHVAGDK